MYYYIRRDETGLIISSLKSKNPSPYPKCEEITKEEWESIFGIEIEESEPILELSPIALASREGIEEC